MNTPSIQAPASVARPAPFDLLARLAALYLKPSQRDLDLALVRDASAPEDLRAQAELRLAWRRWLPDAPFRDF